MSKKTWMLLVAGAVLIALANLRWGVGVLAWIAPVPLLHYLRITSGWRSRVALVGALVIAWTAATFKIVSAPLPPAFGLLGVGFGLYQALGFLVADGVRRRMPAGVAVLAFPAVMVVLEWAQYRFTELATWTATGYTQVDDLPLLQVASVAGLVGIGFVVNLVAAALEHAWARHGARPLAIALSVVVAVHVFGAARLAQEPAAAAATAAPTSAAALAPMIRVAALGTIATFGPDTHLSPAEREQILATLLADTTAAAHAGAKVVVWTEASFLVLPDEEAATIERLRATAAALHIHLVAGYVMPGSPRFHNKLVWLRPDGHVDHTYRKHHPAPGEPAIVGTDPMPLVTDGALRMGGALCYDYDFPQIAAEHGAQAIDLVAVPSSDWRGIDPIHTQMAAVRAIEQGVSIVRATRFGLSAGIDPHGRLRAWASSFEAPDRVLIVDLPARGQPTLYRHIGDAFVYACIAFVLGALVVARMRRR